MRHARSWQTTSRPKSVSPLNGSLGASRRHGECPERAKRVDGPVAFSLPIDSQSAHRGRSRIERADLPLRCRCAVASVPSRCEPRCCFPSDKRISSSSSVRMAIEIGHTRRSSAQDDVDTRDQEPDLGGRNLADPFGEERLIERNDLRNVRDRILGEAGRSSGK